MRIDEIYAAGRFGLSIEIFPPKTTDGDAALFENLERLTPYSPSFVSCTYGAGGSTRNRTVDLCEQIQTRYGIPATAHFTCVGSTRQELCDWLAFATSRGIQNIMALRGDPPAGQETFVPVDGGLKYANELVQLIRREHPQMGIGIAGYPEKHPEAPDAARDLAYLKQKADAGANAIFTQLFYDNDAFYRFRDACVAAGITLPIVPGVMPITEFARIKRITAMCRAVIPPTLAARLEAAAEDKQAQFDIGVEFALEQCRDLLAHGIPGIHFYVLNRSQACEQILNGLDLKPAR